MLVNSVSFNDQDPGTTSDPHTITINNAGGSDQPLGPVSLGGLTPDAFAVSGTCAAILAAMSSCNEQVTFIPPGEGDFSATMDVVDPQGNLLASVNLTGHGGTGTPNVSITPDLINFGSVKIGDSSDDSVTLTNNGTAAVNIASVDLNPEDDAYAISGDCSGPLQAGASCSVDITFSPADASYHDTTMYVTDDRDNTVGTVDLFGAGYDPSAINLPRRRGPLAEG